MTDDKNAPLERDVDPSGESLAEDLTDPGDYEVSVDETEAEELDVADDEALDDTPDKGDPEDVVVDDPEQLAQAETVAAKARSSRPVKKSAVAPVAKPSSTSKKPVARKSRPVERKRRTTPVMFVNQSVGELRKVNWPTGDQLRQYFIVVLVFVVLIIAFVGVLDLAFGWTLLKLLGGKTPTSP